MKISEAISLFIKQLEIIDRSPETVSSYHNDMNFFVRHLENYFNCHPYLEDVSIEDIEQYLNYLREEKQYKASSRKRKLAVLCSFYKFCVRKRLCSHNVAADVQPIKQKTVERGYLSEELVEEMIEAIDHPLIHLVVQTLYYTGLRISECCSLTLADVDFNKNVIRVIEGKGGKDRVIPMNIKLREFLSDYRDNWRAESGSDIFFCTREQLAEQLGYANYRSLDKYMKRKQFTWYPSRNNYFPNKGKKPENDPALGHQVKGRVLSIISLLQRGIEPREIAKQLKFSDHREMAKYMRIKGYEWNEVQSTYVLKASSNVVIEMPSSPSEPREPKSQPEVVTGGKSLEHYIPILQILESNHHKLLQLLESQENDSGVIPRYVMPGVYVTKSVHMVYGLDQLVREFTRRRTSHSGRCLRWRSFTSSRAMVTSRKSTC